MELTSFKFIALAIGSIFIYYLLSQRYRVWMLNLLSLLFIASYSYTLLIYVVAYALMNFLFGWGISSCLNKKVLFRIGLLANLTQLIILKYSSFAINPFLNLLGCDIGLTNLSKIFIPIGISYFTLQGLGYLINIKMGWEKPEMKFQNFLLYYIFYPKFLSGPVERSNHFLPQLNVQQRFNQAGVTSGLRMILLGLFKKVVIANQLALYVNSYYSNIDTELKPFIWMIIIIQPLYLYFDFSGYTDIAIGIARIYGINLLPNFNKPFVAENVTNFWKRFHMSLSSWFNDYVFKQISYKRRKWGLFASVWAMMVTWTLFGIWHGAGWNFMFLGMMQALAILYEFFTKKWRVTLFLKLPKVVKLWGSRFLTYLFYGTSLLFFFSSDMKSEFAAFPFLFKGGSLFPGGERIELLIISLILALVFISAEVIENDQPEISARIRNLWSGEKSWNRLIRWVSYFFAVTAILILSNETQEFIYFQF
ncbi:MAG: MBOAT family protein [Prolixibacteraceae bacterium]|jgi:D-alanyl-lipoteichoic acid acyltransferase DltB (MBOAT superfamily)|nr:MBOAT family protein [Prolixibacteraceae bacterium]